MDNRILGIGLDICYPQEHRVLMEKIKEEGLILLEYQPGTKTMKFNTKEYAKSMDAK